MSNSKISALTGATTPLAGTEVLPIVQSSTTKQVSVANLTAGRSISATQMTLTTGNLIVASGQGIDFSATPGTGTSELLADYEEGTWTPTQGAGLIVVGAFSSSGTYTKIGRSVTLSGLLFGATSINTSANDVMTAGFPFTSGSQATGTAVAAGLTSFVDTVLSGASMYSTGSLGAGPYIFFSITYFV